MTKQKKIIVIGGSAAGPKAAARARRLDQDAEIILIQKDADLSMASCGYPYYVGGFFDDRNQLLSTSVGVIRNPVYYLNAKGIEARIQAEATKIDRERKTVTCRNVITHKTELLEYDKLIVATGSTANIPNVPGKDLRGITTLKSMEDADFLRRIRDEGRIKRAAVVGGGLIGVETCEALQLAGIEITVIELLPQILMFLDWQLAKILEDHIRSKAANVITGNGISQFLGEDGVLTAVKLLNGTELPCELAVIAAGVRPNADLARQADLKIGEMGGIVVDRYMQTSDPDIYAVGDCTEQHHLILGGQTYAPLGDLANLEGRVAGENAVLGNVATFPGTVQSGICKIFDYAAGSTGLSETKARELGHNDITSVVIAGTDKPGFMKGRMLVSKMVVDNKSRRIIGFQCIGPGDVSKQVAQAAIAIQGKMTVHDLVNLDLPYAPPFSLAIDNFIACAHVMENKLKGRFKGISAEEVKEKIDRRDDMYLLDVRGPDEFEASRLGLGETLIPLGMLRKRLNELPIDKDKEIITYCKISLRGYEAALILESQGWRNVKVLEGGIAAWPFAREK
ncbi:MAG: NADH peroxidase [Syntrophorhabdaceae bacterium PtaU1.Bin034]|nr:MAG: NADH peroxidase [Syntrophorhabdaceae bacterium PtaU1.Bin034]